MNNVIANIIMKNGKEHLIKIAISENNISMNDILTKYIYRNYNPRAALNINTFDLAIDSEKTFNSVAIDVSEISSIEYSGNNEVNN